LFPAIACFDGLRYFGLRHKDVSVFHFLLFAEGKADKQGDEEAKGCKCGPQALVIDECRNSIRAAAGQFKEGTHKDRCHNWPDTEYYNTNNCLCAVADILRRYAINVDVGAGEEACIAEAVERLAGYEHPKGHTRCGPYAVADYVSQSAYHDDPAEAQAGQHQAEKSHYGNFCELTYTHSGQDFAFRQTVSYEEVTGLHEIDLVNH